MNDSFPKPVLGSLYDVPETFTVTKTRQENYRIKTVFFDKALPCSPGQFVMLWIPGVNERPLSAYRSDPLAITIANVGKFSGRVYVLNPGDRVGIRGPYGNRFELHGKNVLLVGGGYGLVPLSFLAEEAKKRGVKATVVIGARNGKDVILEKDFEIAGCRTFICTEDGSRGLRARSPDVAAALLAKEKFSAIYGCGPEKMEEALVQTARKHRTPCFVSVERHMKCAFGICGACACGDRLACAHGPVFSAEELEGNPDFGKTFLDWGGKRQSYE